MQRGRLLIILGVVLLLIVIGAVVVLFVGGGDLTGGGAIVDATTEPQAGGGSAISTEIPTTEVIVALQPIARGSEFVAGSIGRRSWPRDNVPPDIIADEAETIGKVAKTEIVQGQVIVRSMLADLAGAGEASFQIPPGRVAVAYNISRQTSVAFAIQPGDFVDILTTAWFVDVDQEFQTVKPNKLRFFFPEIDDATGEPTGTFTLSDPIDEGRFEIASGDIPAVVLPSDPSMPEVSGISQIPRRVAQLTVPAAKVIKVGPWIEPPPPPPPPEPEEGEGPPPTPTPNLPDVVTLAVTPQDALVLLWLRQNKIYTEMALRAAGEENADHQTEAVTLQYMLTRFNIAVPPKIEFIMMPSEFDREQVEANQQENAPANQQQPPPQR